MIDRDVRSARGFPRVDFHDCQRAPDKEHWKYCGSVITERAVGSSIAGEIDMSVQGKMLQQRGQGMVEYIIVVALIAL